jgi:Ca2+-binding RTX toxin-like protein
VVRSQLRMPAWLASGIVLSIVSVLLTPPAAHAGARSTGGFACTIVGTKHGDVLRGTGKKDVICGRGGNDVIKGGGGNDILDGGPGKDRLSGGVGLDRIFGGSGNDVLSGNKGRDRLDGGVGADRLSGGSDGDIVKGADGNDLLDGGAGNDTLLAGTGQDHVSGKTGNDALAGNAGADRLDGGSGADRISGDHGDDVVTGASGNDVLGGGPGNDRVDGFTGDDDLSGGAGTDRVDGGSGFNLCDVPDPGDRQVRCAIDEHAPAVGTVVPSPSVVDVTAAARIIQIRVHVTDDTGVKSVQVGPRMATLVSGTVRDGVWQAGIEIARFLAPGPRAVPINARDRVGRANYESRENVYTVVNQVVDREMPVITSFGLSTSVVDVRSAAQPITATMTVTDDLAGPKDVYLCITLPIADGTSYGTGGGCKPMKRLSGGPRSSTWQGTISVPQGAVGGTWNAQVSISDAADNFANDFWYAPEAFAAVARYDEPRNRQIPGGAGSFTVVGAAPDLQPPALTSLTLDPSTVDTSRGAVRVTANISGTDDEGISALTMSISGPPADKAPGTWPTVDVALVNDFRLVSGTTRNGMWQATFVVPGGTPNGRYWIQARLSDRSNSPSWASPGPGWGSEGTLDQTPQPSSVYFVVENLP